MVVVGEDQLAVAEAIAYSRILQLPDIHPVAAQQHIALVHLPDAQVLQDGITSLRQPILRFGIEECVIVANGLPAVVAVGRGFGQAVVGQGVKIIVIALAHRLRQPRGCGVRLLQKLLYIEAVPAKPRSHQLIRMGQIFGRNSAVALRPVKAEKVRIHNGGGREIRLQNSGEQMLMVALGGHGGIFGEKIILRKIAGGLGAQILAGVDQIGILPPRLPVVQGVEAIGIGENGDVFRPVVDPVHGDLAAFAAVRWALREAGLGRKPGHIVSALGDMAVHNGHGEIPQHHGDEGNGALGDGVFYGFGAAAPEQQAAQAEADQSFHGLHTPFSWSEAPER